MGLYGNQILFVICSYLCLISVCCAALEECQRVDDCACKLKDGNEINIRSLGYQGSKAPRFEYEFDAGNTWQYALNPCYAWSDTTACKNVIACQKAGAGSPPERFAIGYASPATWTQENDAYVVKYNTSAPDHTRTSVVTLACDKTADTPTLDRLGSTSDPLHPDTTLYNFKLTSKCCCPGGCNGPSTQAGGISVGSVLCIIVSVLVVVYLVAGVLFMKFGRHAEGREIIPNYGIWAGLFGSIRDGFVFVVSCGKRSGYDDMKS